ncbi:hypothetical protein JCM10207_003399 [Rhodosporidiobolus poonsookiae]
MDTYAPTHDFPAASEPLLDVSLYPAFEATTPPVQDSPSYEQQQQVSWDVSSPAASVTTEKGDPTWRASDDEDDDEAGTGASAGFRHDKVPESPDWLAEVEDALHKGLKLFPYVGPGPRNFKLAEGKHMNRAEILGEYIRRQTGKIRTAHQVNTRLQTLKNAGTNALKRIVCGDKVSSYTLNSTDWQARLGSDLYPGTEAELETKQAEYRSKRAEAKKRRAAAAADVQHGSTDYLPSPPLTTHKRVKLEPASPSAYNYQPFEYLPDPADIPTSFHAQPLTFRPFKRVANLAPAAPYPTLSKPSFLSDDKPVLSAELDFPTEPFLADSQPLPAAQLSAFLSSLLPTHDFLATAQTLSSTGLASLDALLSFLHLDANTTDAFFELLVKRGKLSGVEVGWVKKALGRAKDELDADDGAMSPAR